MFVDGIRQLFDRTWCFYSTAELEGIIGALELVDSAKDITFVAMDLNRLPGKGTGNANICNSYGVNETIIYV